MSDELNSGPGWYEVIHPSKATTHIAYVYEDGSIYFPEGKQVLGRHEFEFAAAQGKAHRLVRADADVIREIKAEAWDEGYGRGRADHCDYWPSHEGCEVSSPNPYLERGE